MTAKTSDAAKQEAKKALLDLLDDGATVYTVLRSVSRSGMSRTLDMFAVAPAKPRLLPRSPTDTENVYAYDQAYLICLSGYAADLCGFTVNRKASVSNLEGRIVIRGCGMDMGFHAVDTLARELGIELKQRWL